MAKLTSVDTALIVGWVHRHLDYAIRRWLRGFPHSEEALLNHMSGNVLFRRSCDIGMSERLLGKATGLELHRRGPDQTDRYGCDLAVTFSVPGQNYTKTAFIQLKRHAAGLVKIEKKQLDDALQLPYVANRAFALAVSETPGTIRLKSVANLALEQLDVATHRSRLDESWLSMEDWLRAWLECRIGDPSRPWTSDSPESHLQSFAAAGTDPIWGTTPVDWPPESDLVPAQVWVRYEFGDRPE